MGQDPRDKGEHHSMSVAALPDVQLGFRDCTCTLGAGSVGSSATKEGKKKILQQWVGITSKSIVEVT